jgi:hypothetical protein
MFLRFVFPRIHGIEKDKGESLLQQDVDALHFINEVLNALNIKFCNLWFGGVGQRLNSDEFLTSHEGFCFCGDL